MKALDHLRERTGIYKLGFNPASVAGFMFPGVFVILVAGAVSAYLLLK